LEPLVKATSNLDAMLLWCAFKAKFLAWHGLAWYGLAKFLFLSMSLSLAIQTGDVPGM
jgi:hypothetical protein